MKPRFTPLMPGVDGRHGTRVDDIAMPAFDSIVVEQLKCELRASRIVEQTLRARLANAQRLLQAAIGDSE